MVWSEGDMGPEKLQIS